MLGLEPYLTEMRVASLFRSAAVSPIPQPDYLNTAVVARSWLGADELLGVAKSLELAAGRLPGPRFGPRPLDIDLLVYAGLTLRLPELTVPHPRLRERRFVLAPLAEIAPELRPTPTAPTVLELLGRLGSAPGALRLAWSTPPAAKEQGPPHRL